MISDVRDAAILDTLRSRFLKGPGEDWVSGVNGVPVKEYNLVKRHHSASYFEPIALIRAE